MCQKFDWHVSSTSLNLNEKKMGWSGHMYAVQNNNKILFLEKSFFTLHILM